MSAALVAAFSHHTGLRLGEIAGLLILFAGVWIAVAQLGLARFRTIVAGIALAAAGILLIVAIRWGGFG